MKILDTIHSREDLLRLDNAQTEQLCAEIRAFLVQTLSKTGGHLASNLGVVELTVAIQKVFDTSTDRLVFDVGHQSYVHKLLTGRMDQFGTLRQYHGLAGFPSPARASMTRSLPATPPTPFLWRWAWPGPGPCRGSTIPSSP